ncbi:type II toxin-antitoxin system tRNA(fMet)-specific endonuclease VapC [Brachyspira aalborgi]|uniref:Type II toxin-antitoxin system VapC family toxin n=1 Tax=Brachyspira aalborgi TaxID=29522 RepID=A0A5C8EN85_9SPIR|nr:type II toxin-antitoxin system VapC family toxin [Brachyspira aalborgi]TXJ39275.1 type II toxin-antitoxin system VapC family toxin [Brachyspira aalborgi]
MKKLMLDTNICIYIIKNKPLNVRKKFENYNFGEIAISSITVSELYYGTYKSSKQEQNLLSLNNFLSPFNIIEFDIECTLAYGKIRAELENKGQIIGYMDMLIASCSLAKDFTLITNNIKEFKRIKGLRVENWI